MTTECKNPNISLFEMYRVETGLKRELIHAKADGAPTENLMELLAVVEKQIEDVEKVGSNGGGVIRLV